VKITLIRRADNLVAVLASSQGWRSLSLSGAATGPGAEHVLLLMSLSRIVHLTVLGGLETVAVPDPLPAFAAVSKVIVTLRSPLAWVIVPPQPLTLGVPVPLAISTPLQKNWKSPVTGLNNTKFPGLVSSCKHMLNVVTVNVHCVVLFDVSVAVQVTVVVPTGKIDPDGGLQTTDCTPQLSVAAGAGKVTTLPVANGQDADAVAVAFAGHPLGNTGG
jgi:hypothetical protein